MLCLCVVGVLPCCCFICCVALLLLLFLMFPKQLCLWVLFLVVVEFAVQTNVGFPLCQICCDLDGLCPCAVLCMFSMCVGLWALTSVGWMDGLILCLGLGWARVAVTHAVVVFPL